VLTGSRLCEKYTDNALQRTGIINNYYPWLPLGQTSPRHTVPPHRGTTEHVYV
jgi:hypothetical protein